MIRRRAIFACADSLTPEVAARLTQLDGSYQANLHLEYNGVRVRLDSLIGILSVPCHRGSELFVIAEGSDEQAAADAIQTALETRQ